LDQGKATVMVMDTRIGQDHFIDANYNPHGGRTWGPGLEITWQAGLPAITGRSGAEVEDVIDAAIGRLEHYQEGPGGCLANSAAIDALRKARHHLDSRGINSDG
jgi:hypothetical protein